MTNFKLTHYRTASLIANVLRCTQDAPHIADHDEAFGTANPDPVGSCCVLRSYRSSFPCPHWVLHHPFMGTILPLLEVRDSEWHTTHQDNTTGKASRSLT